MKDIQIGIKHEKFMTVEEQDLATRWGSGKAKVFSTPAMIAFMELTSAECIETFLENDEITVGTMVNIQHLKASPLGSKVKCECDIKEVKGKMITLYVSCYVDSVLIGTGIHSRYVVNKQNFEKKAGGD
ncbi:thioesterase family protein [Caviibacter abscessus]|uniref:thioesterase family protein n=1 Tax=Caviibacter abscessus TaxID=1766719 RepID=UPI000832A13E|nr:thioesterase family protein [Caviibacter abscessus]